jgi:hypothetical protein
MGGLETLGNSASERRREIRADASKSGAGMDIGAELRKSKLSEWGLIDDEYLRENNGGGTVIAVLATIHHEMLKLPGDSTNFLMHSGVLTPADFRKNVAGYSMYSSKIDIAAIAYFFVATRLRQAGFKKLIAAGILTRETLWNKFLFQRLYYDDSDSIYNGVLKNLGLDPSYLIDVVDVTKMNDKNQGLIGVEIDGLRQDLLGRSRKVRVYPLINAAHPLAKRLRAQENVEAMSSQIRAAIGERCTNNPIEDLDRVFKYYLVKARSYRRALRRGRRSMARKGMNERNIRIQRVNFVQERKLTSERKGGQVDTAHFDSTKRHFDIYARYGHGQMDPLQLAFIAKAAEWYIMGGRSKLFNSVRVVPYRYYNEEDVPHVAVAACKGATLLKVGGGDFINSMLGANRTFLTNSASREANRMHSIPIVGLATLRGAGKSYYFSRNKRVVFNADFDPKDSGRFSNPFLQIPDYLYNRGNANGKIAGLIHETLRSIMEVEDKEIRNADIEINRIAGYPEDPKKVEDKA